MKNVVVIFFVVFQLSAQDMVYKEINYKSQNLQIRLGDIDKIKLTNSIEKKIKIRMDGYVDSPYGFSVREENNTILVSSILKRKSYQEMNKFCVEQPFFPSYQITIPKNAKVEILYNNGNFSVEDFIGQLQLYVNNGNIEINNCSGSIALELFSGNIEATLVKNTKITVQINKGNIVNNIFSDVEEMSKTILKQTYGTPVNYLKVKAILANITINGIGTQ